MSETACWLALLGLCVVIATPLVIRARRRWDAHERAMWDRYRGVA